MVRTPSQRPKRGTDLSALFNVAAQALASNQSSLNQADVENQNHGDNMVQAFNMISQAMANQRGAPPSTQLQHASEYLAQNVTSGSGQIYAQGLAQAAQQFQGQSAVTPDNAMLLIQSLLGGGSNPVNRVVLTCSDRCWADSRELLTAQPNPMGWTWVLY